MKIRDRIKSLRRVKASELLPNPKNWRTHPTEQQDAMRGVLAEVGIADAVLARETPEGLVLIDGHLRADVAPDTKWPVLVLDVTEAEADKIMATHDPLAAMAGTDSELLKTLLDDIETSNAALQEMLDGMADDAGLIEPPEIEEDEPPEPPADPITKPGDLWLLGDHRVLCGDATSAEDVERLMGGEKARLFLTDPPYGLAENWGGLQTLRGNAQVAGDESIAGWPNWFGRAMNGWLAVISDDASFYCWYAHQANPRGIVEKLGLSVHADIVWVKEHFNIGRCDYHSQHERCLYFSRGDRYWSGRRDISDVWEAPRVEQERMHPTQKPMSLMCRIVENSSKPADTVYDPFLGSGTTLIAAEQLGRKCFGLEISPAYVDVICQRWENLTGKKATR